MVAACSSLLHHCVTPLRDDPRSRGARQSTHPPQCNLRRHQGGRVHVSWKNTVCYCGMLRQVQQLQAAERVDCLSVKCTQLAAPALVSWHVAFLVPVNIDLCRKTEWDLTHNHFPLKSIHCEGLSVCHRWCEADSVSISVQSVSKRYNHWATLAPGHVIIVRGSALPELDCTLTNSLIDDKDNRSVVFDGAVHLCVFVCVCVLSTAHKNGKKLSTVN